MGFYKTLGQLEDETGSETITFDTAKEKVYLDISGSGSITVKYVTPGGHAILIDDADGHDLSASPLYLEVNAPIIGFELTGAGTYSATAGY